MKYQADFVAKVERFEKMGEKTGWTYILIPECEAIKMHSNDRKSFRVKGLLDSLAIAQVALMPMGEGDFILPVNAAMRKQLKPVVGASIRVQISKDDSTLTIVPELMECLQDAPDALQFFKSLAPSHQKYFSKWIDEAKTETTRTKRLAQAVEGLARKMDYATMIKWGRESKLY